MFEKLEATTKQIFSNIHGYSLLQSTSIKTKLFSRMKIKKYIEFCCIFLLKSVFENLVLGSLLAFFMNIYGLNFICLFWLSFERQVLLKKTKSKNLK